MKKLMTLVSCLFVLAVAATADTLEQKIAKHAQRTVQTAAVQNGTPTIPMQVLNWLKVDVTFSFPYNVLDDSYKSADNPAGIKDQKMAHIHCNGMFVTDEGYVAIAPQCIQTVKNTIRKYKRTEGLNVLVSEDELELTLGVMGTIGEGTYTEKNGRMIPDPFLSQSLVDKRTVSWQDFVKEDGYYGISFLCKSNNDKADLQAYLTAAFKRLGRKITADDVKKVTQLSFPRITSSRFASF